MNSARKGGIQSTVIAKFGSAAAPVKSFSVRLGLISGFILFYSGWFFANAVLHFAPESGDLSTPAGPNIPLPLLILAAALFAIGLISSGYVLTAAARQALGAANAPSGLFPVPGGQSFGTAGNQFGKLFAVILLLILAALHIKICVVERVEVSGSSMAPTLHNGEVIWIEKMSSGFQLPDLSFPFGNITPTGKLPAYGLGRLGRGDVVVFRYPGMGENRNDYYIKRVIGLPGDLYEIAGGRVYINGDELLEPYLPVSTQTLAQPRFRQPAVYPLPLELNLLPPDVRQSALFGTGRRGRIPQHTLLLMGDNRELSRDSRSIGFIPIFFILGVAF
jgi:signal peptidase I